MAREKVLQIFTHNWGAFYFTLGRGHPSREISEIWFTHGGEILGCFTIAAVVRNEGQLPRLKRLDGEKSEWQIRPDHWVAACNPPFVPAPQKAYYSGFRGWRYFDWTEYLSTIDAKVPL